MDFHIGYLSSVTETQFFTLTYVHGLLRQLSLSCVHLGAAILLDWYPAPLINATLIS